MLGIVAALTLTSTPAGAESLAQGPLPVAQSVNEIAGMSVDEVSRNLAQWKIPILLGLVALIGAFLMAGGLLRPGGFNSAGLREITSIPSAIWMFAALVVFLAMLSSGTVLERVEFYQNADLDDFQRETVVRLVGYLFGGVAGLGMLYVLGKSCDKGGMRLAPLDFAVGMGCFAIAWPLVELASECGTLLHRSLSDGADYYPEVHPILEHITSDPSSAWSWLLILGILVGAPLVQELIYRVFVQTAVLRLTGSAWFSILFSATAFALMERLLGSRGNEVPWHSLLPLFALGLACGIAYERTKRVGVPIAMHAGFNGLNLLLAFLFSPEMAEPGAASF
ncbi:MAG: CPBP family intramembrane glutamic endopeptidase [Phycisphaerales bacterium JB040]